MEELLFGVGIVVLVYAAEYTRQLIQGGKKEDLLNLEEPLLETTHGKEDTLLHNPEDDSFIVTMSMLEHLKILGIEIDSGKKLSLSDFKLQCSKLYKSTHPDKGGTAETFRKIRRASESVLSILSSNEYSDEVSMSESCDPLWRQMMEMKNQLAAWKKELDDWKKELDKEYDEWKKELDKEYDEWEEELDKEYDEWEEEFDRECEEQKEAFYKAWDDDKQFIKEKLEEFHRQTLAATRESTEPGIATNEAENCENVVLLPNERDNEQEGLIAHSSVVPQNEPEHPRQQVASHSMFAPVCQTLNGNEAQSIATNLLDMNGK